MENRAQRYELFDIRIREGRLMRRRFIARHAIRVNGLFFQPAHPHDFVAY